MMARTTKRSAAQVKAAQRIDRAQVALDELMKLGHAPTMRELLAYLKLTTGRGCSLRDCHRVLKLHAQRHAALEHTTLQQVLRDVQKRCAPLNVTSRGRVYRALNAHIWQEAAR
jgi:hypothetical protein